MAPSLYSTERGQRGPKGGSDVGSLAVFLGIERGYKQGKFATQWRNLQTAHYRAPPIARLLVAKKIGQ